MLTLLPNTRVFFVGPYCGVVTQQPDGGWGWDVRWNDRSGLVMASGWCCGSKLEARDEALAAVADMEVES